MRAAFGIGDDYVRPLPARWWQFDLLVAGAFLIFLLINLGLRGSASLPLPKAGTTTPAMYVAALTAVVLVVFRRRFANAVCLLLPGVHFTLVGVFLPSVVVTVEMQVMYFFVLYTGIAWAKNRRAIFIITCIILATMTVWLTVSMLPAIGKPIPFHVKLWTIIYILLLNAFYFGGSIGLGLKSWWGTRSTDKLEAAQRALAAQTEQLQQAAVISERMRIARELHDSVAHHVTLLGIQVAAARRAMHKRPEAATATLLKLEDRSRSTVQELQAIVGSLRQAGETEQFYSLDALPALFDEFTERGLNVEYTVVGDIPELDRARTSALYRIIQESLNNVCRHSQASRAHVWVRGLPHGVEVEVLDDGPSSHAPAGNKVGHQGIRERVAVLGGTTEIGPRSTRGYRVRVVLTQGET